MDWKKNRLFVALAALVALAVAVTFTLRENRATEGTPSADVTLPRVDTAAVDTLELVRPGKDTIKLSKQGDAWKLVAPVEAEADESAVKTILDKLADLEVTGVAARRPENHKRLEVDDESGIVVTAKKGDDVLASLVVGASRTAGTMVREKGKDEVVSVKGAIRYAFNKDTKLFRNRKIVDASEDKLSALRIESEKGTFRFQRGESEWSQADGEKPIKHFAAHKVKALASTLTRLRAADFAGPDETPDKTGLDKPSGTAVLTFKPDEEGGQPTTVTLHLGAQREGSSEYYLQREGEPTVYLISKYTAERFLAEPSAFAEEPEDKDKDGTSATAPTPKPTAPSKLPPEIMRQLQQQLQKQGH